MGGQKWQKREMMSLSKLSATKIDFGDDIEKEEEEFLDLKEEKDRLFKNAKGEEEEDIFIIGKKGEFLH